MDSKPCKMCGRECPKDKLSSKGFCDKCVIQRYINYHEKALAHYRKVLEEYVEGGRSE